MELTHVLTPYIYRYSVRNGVCRTYGVGYRCRYIHGVCRVWQKKVWETGIAVLSFDW